jgi:hypothetical protein
MHEENTADDTASSMTATVGAVIAGDVAITFHRRPESKLRKQANLLCRLMGAD